MTNIRKYVHASVLIVLCRKYYLILIVESPYFYVICNISNTKKLDDNINLITINQDVTKIISFWQILDHYNDNSSEYKKEIALTPKEKNKEDDNLIFCEGILSMDMNNPLNYLNKTKSNIFTIVIPLNYPNIASFGVLFVLILFGTFYLLKIITRKKCLCKVCKSEYKIVEHLGEGGFGEVINN
jgi:predicted PurR-regulated permease PerM